MTGLGDTKATLKIDANSKQYVSLFFMRKKLSSQSNGKHCSGNFSPCLWQTSIDVNTGISETSSIPSAKSQTLRDSCDFLRIEIRLASAKLHLHG